MKKIIPVLWFEKEGEKAVDFYTSIFPKSMKKEPLYGPDGNVVSMEFMIGGVDFGILNGGAFFEKNPSISFNVHPDNKEEVDRLWEKLSSDGEVLMPLQKYDFSEYYGWVRDSYGVSWQLNLGEKIRPMIFPNLLFTREHYGKAEKAINAYTSIFDGSRIHTLYHYGEDQLLENKDALMYGAFQLEHQQFTAMDSGLDHDFTFNEGISLMVVCDTQEEVDDLWEKLSADPEAEKCGWLKDEFGISWQIVPKILIEYLKDEDDERAIRVTNAMLKMKKLKIEELKKAHLNDG